MMPRPYYLLVMMHYMLTTTGNPGYYYYDLGAEWQAMTGLTMVYALWVVNRNFTMTSPTLLQMVYEQVTGAFAYGLAHLPAAAASLAGQVAFTNQQLIHYIQLLNYEFTPAHEQALLTYYKLAHEPSTIGTKIAAATVITCKVLKKAVASHMVRLSDGSRLEGITNGNMEKPAVRMTRQSPARSW